MISSDAGATSSSINSPTAPSPMPMLSPTPSLTLSPVSTTSDNSNHRPFAGGLLSVDGSSGLAANFVTLVRSDPIILSAIAEQLERRSRNASFDFASYQRTHAHAVPADAR